MPVPIQDINRLEIRQSIGRNLGIVLIGKITSAPGDKTSVIDTTNLTGGDDDHNGKQILIFDPAGSIVAGEIRRVTDYAGSSSDATVTAFSQNTAVGDDFEMWDTPWLIGDINDAINQAIITVSKNTLLEKKTEDSWTAANTYEYAWLSGFKGLHKVEYARSVGIEVVVDRCDTLWTAGSNVTASIDTSFMNKEGTGAVKLVVAAGASAGAVLGYIDISSIDLSECDKLEFWLYSSIALAVGELDIALDDNAGIVSPIESIDIPATSKATKTRHVVDLANPHSDTDIISVGIINTTDVGACTLYIDDIKGIKSGSRLYKPLNPQYWSIVRNGTNYLRLTSAGKSVVGDDTLIRLSGYQLPALLADDTTDSTIDPDYIISQATGMLAIGNAKSSRLQIKDRAKFSQYWLSIAESKKVGIGSTIFPDSRFF